MAKAEHGDRERREYIYCGTNAKTTLEGTQLLLTGPARAIWFWRGNQGNRVDLQEGDRVWLVWRRQTIRGQPRQAPRFLGWGRIIAAGEGNVFWQNDRLDGVLQEARGRGYQIEDDSEFLHLDEVHISDEAPELGLEGIDSGIQRATPEHVERLNDVQVRAL